MSRLLLGEEEANTILRPSRIVISARYLFEIRV